MTVVSPATDPNSTTVQVWVQADNPGERLKPGDQRARRHHDRDHQGHPGGSGRGDSPRRRRRHRVLVITPDNIAHRRTVKLGVREGDKVQILNGVRPGEEVVIVGGLGVDDKAKVKVIDTTVEGSRRRRRERPAGAGGRQGPEEGRGEAESQMSDLDHRRPDGAALDRPPRQAHHLRHPHAGRGGRLPGASPFRSRFSRTRISRASWSASTTASSPIDQMLVTVTRPIEEAVNSVPGLDHVWSITSRGSAEVDLFFNWNVDMFQTLELVNAALARVQPTLPPTAKITANRLTFAAFPDHGLQPDLGHGSADRALGDWPTTPQAAPQPLTGVSIGGACRAARCRNSRCSRTPPSCCRPASPFPTFWTPSAAAT